MCIRDREIARAEQDITQKRAAGMEHFGLLHVRLAVYVLSLIHILGKWFPTGCHKVGASFGCLAPRLVTGQFDVNRHKAVWPSTGNYCRGGAFNSRLLGAQGVAILPAEMSPVSYTHLDVYKRQSWGSKPRSWRSSCPSGSPHRRTHG